jgi:hypothetical protein
MKSEWLTRADIDVYDRGETSVLRSKGKNDVYTEITARAKESCVTPQMSVKPETSY